MEQNRVILEKLIRASYPLTTMYIKHHIIRFIVSVGNRLVLFSHNKTAFECERHRIKYVFISGTNLNLDSSVIHVEGINVS